MHRITILRRRTCAVASAAVLLALCLLSAGAQALLVPMDDAALATGADEIVRGEIVDAGSGWSDDHTQIETTATVRVRWRAQGSGPETLAVTVPGGTVDGLTLWVEEQPALVPGTEAFLFIRHGPADNRVYGGAQGLVPVEEGRVRNDAKTKGGGVPADSYAEYIAALAAGSSVPPPAPGPTARAVGGTVPVITGVSPSAASAGTGTEITITGTGFGTKASRTSYADVGFTSRYDGVTVTPLWASGYPDEITTRNEIVSWTNTRIVVRVPGSVRDMACSGYLWVLSDTNTPSANYPFTVTFGYEGSKWSGPVSYRVNPSGLDAEAVRRITTAAETWNAAVPDAAFRLDYAGEAPGSRYGYDRQNLVTVGTAEDFAGMGGSSAFTQIWAAGSSIFECDLVLDPARNWSNPREMFGGYALPYVALHEFGHWLSLADLDSGIPGWPSDEGEVMYWGAFQATVRALHPHDAAGIRWIYGNGTPPPPPSSRPYPGPHVVPGTVEAEDFDAGGEGVAYHDADPENRGGAYRPDEGVDLYSTDNRTTVGDVGLYEWLSYTVNATAPQTVVLRLRASNPDPDQKAVIVQPGTVPSFVVLIPPTGSSESFVTAESPPFWLGAGETVVRLDLPVAAGLDWLELAPADLPNTTVIKPPTGPPPIPYPGLHRVPGTVEAEDFDAGGEGVAYHDDEPENLGTAYRPGEGVDLETANGITNVGWVRQDEWLTYTVYATAEQQFVLGLTASNPDDAGKEVHVSVDNAFCSAAYVLPTGSFDAYATVTTQPAFTLPAGESRLRLDFAGGYHLNLDRFELIPVSERAPTPGLLTVPGGAGVPTDTDHDGLYDDVNGNGRKDFADVVLSFNQMTVIADTEPMTAFDYNGNGRIDFADIVWLFNNL